MQCSRIRPVISVVLPLWKEDYIQMIGKLGELTRVLRNRRLSRDELGALRNRRLRAVVRHAYESVPFYRSRFQSVGLHPEDIRTVGDLKYIPVTKKEDLRAAGLDRILAKGVNLASCRRRRTNGSMGKPFDTYLNPHEQWIRRLLGFRRLIDIGFRPQDRVCILYDPTQLPARRYRTKCLSPLLPVQQQVQELQGIQPTVLKAWPSSLQALLHHVDYRLNEFIRPRALVTSGEICTKWLKKKIQAHMDVEMFNFYSAGEFGPIASECRAHEGLHLNADHLVLECCRNGRPVQTDESGFAVLTSLYAYTMPLIRYQLGDICTLTDRQCSCGSNLPLIEAPIGRQDEVIRMPNGKVVSVAAVVNITLRPFEGIDQFLLIQESPYDFLLRIVFTLRPAEEVLSEIRTRMVECLGKPASLDIQVVDFIRWNRGSKYKTFVSMVPQLAS